MDYLLKNRYLSGTSEILDTVSQQAVDLDFTLPDYCADVEKILKCSLVPKIYSRSFSAGQLRVDGASIVRVLYCDSNKKIIRCCEQTVPFSATVSVNAEVSEYIILTTAKSEYLNCRALSPRRLTIHGAFSLNTSIIGKSIYDIKEDCGISALQIKKETKSICELCEFAQEQFNISETVNLHPKSTVETIIRSEIAGIVTDYKYDKDRINIKGEITLRVLYICDSKTGDVDQFVYVFPFTQNIDAKDRDCTTTDVRLDILSYELLLRSGVLTDEPSLSMDIKMCASVVGYKKTDVSYIADAYSVEENTNLSLETLSMCSDVMSVSIPYVVKSTMSLGDKPIQKILDIFCEEPSVLADTGENTLTFSGKIKVCILALAEDGELICIERQSDVLCEEELDVEYGLIKRTSACVNSVSYRIMEENDIEIRFDMQLRALLYNNVNISQVSSVETAGEKIKADNNPLTLYYAEKGESVWNIAKKYQAPLSSLLEENSLEEDELSSSGMILVLNI